MACIIQGRIDIVELQNAISPIFLPLNFKIIEDIVEMSEQDFSSFDGHFEVGYVSNPTESWTILQTLFGGNDLSFEFEEYLADQLNRQYGWVTVADHYRLMADRLRGDVSSGYYSILFKKDHSIFLVDNGTFDDEANSLDFRKLACIFPRKKQKISTEHYMFGEYHQHQYIGYHDDGIFYPIMQCDYVHLVLSELIERWKSKN